MSVRGGRHIWAIRQLAQPTKLISVELAQDAVNYQRHLFSGMKDIEVIQDDVAIVEFQADFIYMVFINYSHTLSHKLQRITHHAD